MVRQTAKVIILEILGGLVLLSILLVGLAALWLSSGPVALGFAKSDIERALQEGRDGRPVTLDEITLEWLADENRAVIIASDLKFFDDAGEVAAQAGRAEILADIGQLFSGRIRPVGITLEEGWINIDQAEDGLRLAGDPIGLQDADPARGELTASEFLELADQAMIDLLTMLRTDAEQLPLESIVFQDIDIVFRSDARDERARLVDAEGDFKRGPDGIQLIVSGQSAGRIGAPASFTGKLNTPGDYSAIEAELVFQDWSIESIANWLAEGAGRVRGLPSDVTLNFRVDSDTGLEEVRYTANAGAGAVVLEERDLPVETVLIDGSYLPQTDTLIARLSEFDISIAQGDISLELSDVLRGKGARVFALEASSFNLDLTPQFSEPWLARRVRAKGEIKLDEFAVQLDQLSLNIDDARLRAKGQTQIFTDQAKGKLPVAVSLSAELTGQLLPQQFLRFWPVNQAPGARDYVSRTVVGGVIDGATAQINITRDSFASGHLADEAIIADFQVSDARAQPLPDLPIIEGSNATGRVTGNSFRLDFVGGTFDSWNISSGFVHYPQLSPAGADMMVNIAGTGAAQDLVRIVSDSRLQIEARTGFDPRNVSGDANMVFELIRPALPNVPIADFRYKGTGIVRSGGLENAFNGLSLTDSDAQVSLDEKGLRVAGFGSLAASPLRYDWYYEFNDEGRPADLKATSVLNPDILNTFGLVGRAYLTGEIPVEFEAKLDGTNLRAVDAAFDLLGARLDVAEVNWVKPQGEPASATLRYAIDADGMPTTSATLEAEDAAFDGTFTLEPDGRLIAANVERAFLKDRADISGIAFRTEEGGVSFQMEGEYLDLSPVFGGVSQLSGSTDSATNFGDMTFNADVKRLRLREGLETTNATFSLVSERDGLQTIEADGTLPNGADFSAAFDTSGLGDPTFLINSGDAGFLLNVIFGLDTLQGGSLQMSGTLATGDLPTQVRLIIEDGRLTEAPFFTQILSLASLRGISDTMTGEGVLFSTIEVPLTIVGDRFNIVGARASGPALGLTARGWLALNEGTLDIDGVLVPSFGVNSALGGIPVLGSLFVSREGEGVISLRYGIEGTLERAQVSVNPLSAITPGIIRRIFENPEDEDLFKDAPISSDAPTEGSTEAETPDNAPPPSP